MTAPDEKVAARVTEVLTTAGYAGWKVRLRNYPSDLIDVVHVDGVSEQAQVEAGEWGDALELAGMYVFRSPGGLLAVQDR